MRTMLGHQQPDIHTVLVSMWTVENTLQWRPQNRIRVRGKKGLLLTDHDRTLLTLI